MRNRTYWAPDDRQRGVDHADHFARSAREDGADTGRVTPGAITDIGGKPDKTVTPGAITDGGPLETDAGIGSTGRDAL